MKLIILVGIQGSGKTTWAKKFVAENKNYVRVSRDDLRNMRGEYWIPKQEKLITQWEDSIINLTLQSGLNVVIDSMNLNRDRVKSRVEKLQTAYPNLTVEYKNFDISLEKAIVNDLKRTNSVGEKVITETYNKYFPKKLTVYTEDQTLPKAILVDIDGTLAAMNGRGPFEWSRVREDKPIKATIDLVSLLYNTYHIILFSGRDSVCKQSTCEWLSENGVKYHSIFMRPENNNKKDSIVKSDLFEQNIRGKFNVQFVIDDRKQVKKMWVEEKGLFVLDVNQTDAIF